MMHVQVLLSVVNFFIIDKTFSADFIDVLGYSLFKVAHCWNNKKCHAIYFKPPNERVPFHAKKSTKSIDSETVFTRIIVI